MDDPRPSTERDNVEIVRRALTAWNDGDFDTWTEVWHPDVVVISPEGWPDGEASRGLEAWKTQAQRLKSSWAEARVEVDDIRSAENRVAVQMRYVTKGEGTSLPFDTKVSGAFFFKDGRCRHAQYFWTFDEALEIAGLAK